MAKTSPKRTHVENDRTGLDKETVKRAYLDHLFCMQSKVPSSATKWDEYMALSYTIRDRIMQRWLHALQDFKKKDPRTVSYLSAEFLLGPHLENNLINLGQKENFREAMDELGLDLEKMIDQEVEPGLGNGGLGRLAACFLDSMASLDIPAIGYGIRYEFGIFDQRIQDGWQVEGTDKWLKFGNPWEVPVYQSSVHVKFGGKTRVWYDEKSNYRVSWDADQEVLAIPYDTPITGYKSDNAVILRLWKAEADQSFDFQSFNEGDFFGAVENKVISENITKVLYPNDSKISGKELRLMQQFFFVSATLQDVIRFHKKVRKTPITVFHEKMTMQLNDTHPSIAVAEMMRLLIDENDVSWDEAWEVTRKTFAYTNHTLLPEALEKWSMPLFGKLLPRHLEIILEINYHFLNSIRKKFPNDEGKISRMSIIDEAGEKYIRMAHLAIVGSYAVNGVAALHTELLISEVLKDFYEMYPEKFSNKTNGVTPRRWMVASNPDLAAVIASKIGSEWIKDLTKLKEIEQYADNKKFKKDWQEAKLSAKQKLADKIKNKYGIELNVNSIFDIQVKRIHEYKRQHLNVLHIITLYNRIKENPNIDIVPRTFIFGGKAAPGYFMAKLIIKLINSVAEVVNHDPDVNGRLKVVFLPNYSVKNSQSVYPAADLSEQISTAGKEASGTGNMKFTMNGALTIGTLDGANIEIREEVGEENFFLFGLDAKQVYELKASNYIPLHHYDVNHELQKVLNMIYTGYFSPQQPNLFHPIVDNLKYSDEYVLMADYQSYIECQDRVAEAYRDQDAWTKMSILNVARSGKFSSDRTIREYCDDIWKIDPYKVKLPEHIEEAGAIMMC
ncbi:glycogen/starch/alpha-glucan phosphorylase [Reichenbachiella versicolor]|uniref:glycogen/starch/alpha-glucan phosphorylase n=1 Tax=Reichenbachiella versicolor TaxID=1821036 RepID=UPI000D6E6A38|nr:glycogen/starch/alpha-glucan phosphorylase [Reichenbachiella versicolor]